MKPPFPYKYIVGGSILQAGPGKFQRIARRKGDNLLPVCESGLEKTVLRCKLLVLVYNMIFIII